jgi:glycosyltransferase involved in cell wall biosynthesis
MATVIEVESAYHPRAMDEPVRCAILAPVPVPYREPLFARLAEHGRVAPTVLYQSASQPGWDQRADWFPHEHPYDSAVLRAWQRRRPGRTPVLLPRGLGRALRRADPACVVSWEYGPATLRALAWCSARHRPLVIFSELTPRTEGGLSAARRRLHRLLAPRAAGFIVTSSAGRERLLALGVPPERVEVSLQSADVARFRVAGASRTPSAAASATPTTPASRSPAADPVRVLSVGRLVPDKNLRLLLDAWVEAGLRPEEARLELVGSGPLEHELRACAERLGVPARFRGYVSPGDLPGAYGEADVLALVSTYEPFGVTVREGVAAGLPVLCTRAAGAAGDFAVAGENAVLVDPLSTSEVAAALRLLVRDHAARERMAAASRRIAAATPPDADVEAFERAVLRAVRR